MYCKFCGDKIDDNSKFCNHCGKNLVSTGTPFVSSGMSLGNIRLNALFVFSAVSLVTIFLDFTTWISLSFNNFMNGHNSYTSSLYQLIDLLIKMEDFGRNIGIDDNLINPAIKYL